MSFNTGLSQSIDTALDTLDELLSSGTLRFIISLWDGEHGGFYYSARAKRCRDCTPDADSTAQVLRLIDSGAFFGSKGSVASVLPGELKDKILSFITSCDSSASVKWVKDKLESRENVKSSTPPIIGAPSVKDHLESRESFRKFLTDNCATASDLKAQFKEIKNAGLTDVMFDYLDSVQEGVRLELSDSGRAPTGLWQTEISSDAMSELARLAALYTEGERRLRYALDIVSTCIGEILSCGEYESVYEIYAPWSALSAVLKNLGTEDGASLYNTVRRSAPDMISATLSRLKGLKRRDGGFSYYPSRRSARIHGARAAFGVREGDINATVTAVHGIRGSIFSSLGLTVPPLWDGEALSDILNTILNK